MADLGLSLSLAPATPDDRDRRIPSFHVRLLPAKEALDMNLVPAEEVEAEVSSPNSTVSSAVSGKRGGNREESENERGVCCSDEDDAAEASRKKLRLSKDQSAVLEESFKEHNTLNPKEKMALAKQLNLRPRQVEVWFQNRRARTKLKQTEVDCEILKRCCENLTEQNRRLQKEVLELRALKQSPQLLMQMTPPTTLTMCPSCERISASMKATDNHAPTTPTQPSANGNSNLRRHSFLHQPQTVLHAQPRPVVAGPNDGSTMPMLPWPTLRTRAFLASQPQRS